MTPDDLPDPESYPHGTRARYVGAKCRCDDCRTANRMYARTRADAATDAATDATTGPRPTHCTGANGQPCERNTKLRIDSVGTVCRYCRPKLVDNSLVPADRARVHLFELSKQGVGINAVRDASGIARTVILDIRTGKKATIRRDTETKILDVDTTARLDCARVDGTETRRLIADLLARGGFTKTALARRLGSEASIPTLQYERDFVSVRTARKVAELHRELELDQPDPEVPSDRDYLEQVIVGAIERGLSMAHEIHAEIEIDIGRCTLRTVHRALAEMVDRGVLARGSDGYAVASRAA